ncbi:hypothetical protein V8C42DRAFT_319746 [Trichoderma barbatum]
MVGIPTSKGCSQCLRRSVKCDEAYPSCSQCRRGGRTCPGYERRLKWIDEGPKMRKSLRRERRTVVEIGPPTKSSGHLASSYLTLAVREKFDEANVSDHKRWAKRHTYSPVDHLISFSSVRDQLVAGFVTTMFPLGSHSAQKSFFGSWLWHLLPRLGVNKTLDHASVSLALAYFGRASGNRVVVHKAQIAYTAALKGLANAIVKIGAECSGDILCSALLLGYYESFAEADYAWIRHAGGAARLMQLRGANRSYESPYEYSMFLACRGTIIKEALTHERTCFLDTSEWRAIPDGLIDFPLLPQPPDLYHTIFGHLASVPGLLSDQKRITTSTPSSLQLRFLDKANSLRRDFKTWYKLFTADSNELHKPVLIPSLPDCSDYPFSSLFMYSDVPAATTIITYYAYLILINKAIDCVSSENLHSKENEEIAHAIGMSVQYCSRAGYCGLQSMRFALSIAQPYLSVYYQTWAAIQLARFSHVMNGCMVQSLHP